MRDVDTKIYQAQTALRGWKSAADVIPLFRKQAQWYEWALAKYLPRDKKRAMILDCGCGAGNFLYFLRSKGYENALGVDIDPKMAAIAKELNMPVQVGDAVEYLRTTSSTYDMIVCFDFLEHLDKDEALEFLQSIYARLKANGVFILRMPCADGLLGFRDFANDLTHKWTATAQAAEGMLKMIGFDSIRVIDELPSPLNVVGAVRFVLAVISRKILNVLLLLLALPVPRVYSTSMIIVAFKPSE